MPGLRRIQYTHGSVRQEGEIPVRMNFLKVMTDEGIEGVCTKTMTPEQADMLRLQVLGENPFNREELYQLMWKGTRWMYQRAGWAGDFDNCLWDILGKAAGMPVCDLIGSVRDRFPVYVTSGESPLEVYLEVIDEARKRGVGAYKFHTYKGGKADIHIFREVRDVVGHVMEELGFIWLEEPIHEQKENQYRELFRELDMPVMGNETIMYDIGLSTQKLMSGAADLLRANDASVLLKCSKWLTSRRCTTRLSR